MKIVILRPPRALVPLLRRLFGGKEHRRASDRKHT